MKKVLLITFLACFWIIFPVMAQQTPEPTPIFPPNPQDIFVEGVNWVLVEPEPITEPTQTSEASLVCADQFPQQDTRRGQWHIVYNAEIEKVVVCFDETLATYDILPEGHDEWQVYGNPNNEWLIIIGRNFDGTGAYQIYSHHLTTSQQNFLGEKRMSIDTSVGVDDWLTDTLGVMYSSIYNYKSPSISYYRFDVETPNSLEFVLSGGEFNANLIKIDSPKRYVAFYSGGEFSNGHGICSLVILDATGIYHHELGYECLTTFFAEGEETKPFYRFSNSVIYYITISQADDTLAELHRYDAVYPLSEQTYPLPLFINEFERILSVSPNEQYIILQTSDDGVIDSPYIDMGCCSEERWRHSVAIIRVDEISSYTPSDWIYESEPLVIPFTSQLAWLDENTLVMLSLTSEVYFLVDREGNSAHNVFPSSLRRIELTESSINTTITTQFQVSSYHISMSDSLFLFYLSPDNLYWLQNDKAINLRTFEEISILKDDARNLYRISMGWLLTDEHTLAVHICPTVCSLRDEITYHITLP